MIRFAWLQSRTQTLATAALLAALAGVAAVTGIQLSHLFHREVAHCVTGCDFAVTKFLNHDVFMDRALDILARAVPALLGVFWGAPLIARELDTGTYRLAWTQTVSRSRWLLTKLALGALATVVLAGLLTLTITWWFRSRDSYGSIPFDVFDRRDIAPISYAVFAFAVGALLGAVIRRTVPAMAATLGAFVFVRVAMSVWVRPHLLPPIHRTLSLQGAGPSSSVQLGVGFSNGGPLQLFVKGGGPPNSLYLSTHLLTRSGHVASSAQLSAFLHQHCPKFAASPGPPPPGPGIVKVGGPDPGRACLAQVAKTFHAVVTYQPGSRYWTFQWLESGIFVALALAAAAGCYWWVTRRTV